MWSQGRRGGHCLLDSCCKLLTSHAAWHILRRCIYDGKVAAKNLHNLLCLGIKTLHGIVNPLCRQKGITISCSIGRWGNVLKCIPGKIIDTGTDKAPQLASLP